MIRRARSTRPARVHWERIETVAESFGDLDPKVDLREADLEKGQKWTGWHRIEKDLWPARAKGYRQLCTAERAAYADDLMRNTNTLYDKTRNLTFTADEIANGVRGLLDEVATGKVTGEEEYWSRTDLWDFQANVDGARVGFEGLRPLLATKAPALDSQIDARFDTLQKLLDAHRSGCRVRDLRPADQARDQSAVGRGRTRPASSPRCRTDCTSQRSTSRPARATSLSRCSRTGLPPPLG